MSTRSRIGIEGEDGQIISVYCHSDGYPEGVGATLLTHFNTAEAVVRLVAEGDLSFCEGPDLSPVGERVSGTTCSYKRWRNEQDVDAKTSENREAYIRLADDCGGEYVYLYGPRGWEYTEIAFRGRQKDFQPLTREAISAAVEADA